MLKRKGFTLIEMLIVAIVITAIWSMVISLWSARSNASLKWVDPDMYQIQLQEEQLERLRQISVQNEELLRQKQELELP